MSFEEVCMQMNALRHMEFLCIPGEGLVVERERGSHSRCDSLWATEVYALADMSIGVSWLVAIPVKSPKCE